MLVTLMLVIFRLLGLWAIVNNAGIGLVGDIELISLEMMKRVAEVNLYGTVRVTKAFIPMIRKSKGMNLFKKGLVIFALLAYCSFLL